jgi:C-terminal processing protease CtpA/Prc
MLIEEMLRALRQVDPDGRVTVTLERPNGATAAIRIAALPWRDRTPLVTAVEAFTIPPGPARVEPQRYYRYEILPGAKALYVRYDKCADDPKESFANFASSLFAAVDASPAAVERVVIDLRANSGGDSRVIEPLLRGLHARKALSARGRLYALVGPATFSSGLLAAITLREDLKAVIVGETPGELVNSYGEVRPLTLPNSRLVVQYSTKFFRLTKDAKAVVDPDVDVRPSIADYLAGRDPVLDTALGRR